MSEYTIGITGVGGGVGQSIIKSLAGSGNRLVGLDGERNATGLFAVPSSYVIPYASSENYIPELLKICKKEKIDLLFPGLDAELPVLAAHADSFLDAGTRVMVSNPAVIHIADDKMATSNWLTDHGFPAPITRLMADVNLDTMSYPVVVKPRCGGARSKAVMVLHNRIDANAWLLNNSGHEQNFVLQEYIEGEEYTCGTVNLDGHCVGAIVSKRVLRDGDTYKTYTIRDTALENWVQDVMNKLKPQGACNVQLRMRNGQPFVFEFNARCSGTTAVRAMCGFNEPLMLADYFLKGMKPAYDIQPKTIFRYWNEIEVDDQALEQINQQGFYQGSFNKL